MNNIYVDILTVTYLLAGLVHNAGLGASRAVPRAAVRVQRPGLPRHRWVGGGQGSGQKDGGPPLPKLQHCAKNRPHQRPYSLIVL